MPSPSTRNRSSEDTSHESPPPSKGNTHLVPNLCGAPDPPVIIMIKSWCKSIPPNEWLLAEELVDLIHDRFIGRRWERQSYVNLKRDSTQLPVLSDAFHTIFSVSSRLGVLSISSVPNISASRLPPFTARSLQYPLIFASPPSHSRKSNAVRMRFPINTDQIADHRMRTRSNAEIENRVVRSDPCRDI